MSNVPFELGKIKPQDGKLGVQPTSRSAQGVNHILNSPVPGIGRRQGLLRQRHGAASKTMPPSRQPNISMSL